MSFQPITLVRLDKNIYLLTTLTPPPKFLEARAHFNEYFRRKLSWKGQERSKFCDVVDIIHRNSQDDPNLQIADYIAGALYEKFEKGDAKEYLLIKDKIRYTHVWGNISW